MCLCTRRSCCAARSPASATDRARRVLGASYLCKWVVLGATIGIVAGLGAVAFITALQWSNHFLLGALGGYHAPMRRS